MAYTDPGKVRVEAADNGNLEVHVPHKDTNGNRQGGVLLSVDAPDGSAHVTLWVYWGGYGGGPTIAVDMFDSTETYDDKAFGTFTEYNNGEGGNGKHREGTEDQRLPVNPAHRIGQIRWTTKG